MGVLGSLIPLVILSAFVGAFAYVAYAVSFVHGEVPNDEQTDNDSTRPNRCTSTQTIWPTAGGNPWRSGTFHSLRTA
jgi:hypothetical protein